MWTFQNIFLIFMGGGLGSVARFGVVQACKNSFVSTLPLGTLVVNVLGSFLMGFLVAYLQPKWANSAIFFALGVGFLGGFTTFSSFSMDMYELIGQNQIGLALLYSLASFVFSVIAIFLGAYVFRGL